MISSPDIDKLLRKYLSPILRENGFAKVTARKAWGWQDHCVSVFQIRAVGSYFSDVTGWPPMSVCAWTGVYYDFIPFEGHTPPRRDEKGRLVPDEAYCSAGKCKEVAVCHKPGTLAQKTLAIPLQALAGHLGHGDTTAPCQ
jgi:hypothetical protein